MFLLYFSALCYSTNLKNSKASDFILLQLADALYHTYQICLQRRNISLIYKIYNYFLIYLFLMLNVFSLYLL